MTRVVDDGAGFEVDLDSIDSPAREIIQETRTLFLDAARAWMSPVLSTDERIEAVMEYMARARTSQAPALAAESVARAVCGSPGPWTRAILEEATVNDVDRARDLFGQEP